MGVAYSTWCSSMHLTYLPLLQILPMHYKPFRPCLFKTPVFTWHFHLLHNKKERNPCLQLNSSLKSVENITILLDWVLALPFMFWPHSHCIKNCQIYGLQFLPSTLLWAKPLTAGFCAPHLRRPRARRCRCYGRPWHWCPSRWRGRKSQWPRTSPHWWSRSRRPCGRFLTPPSREGGQQKEHP